MSVLLYDTGLQKMRTLKTIKSLNSDEPMCTVMLWYTNRQVAEAAVGRFHGKYNNQTFSHKCKYKMVITNLKEKTVFPHHAHITGLKIQCQIN